MVDKKAPTFSIVTPSYNQGDFLGRTIESVISQAGNFYIEYFIADGGSSDNSVEVIKSYAKKLESENFKPKCAGIKFDWWSKKDKGQSDAINQGFTKATGDYIAWLNSDDMYKPGAMKEAAEAFQKYPDAGLIYTNWVDVNEDDEEIEFHKVIPFDLDFEINVGNILPQPASFMNKKALDEVGLLNLKYNYAMDYDLWIRIGKKFPIYYVDSCWASFRLHEESKTVSLTDRFWPEVREISRKNGGKYFSPLLSNHLKRKYPLLMKPLHKILRGVKILMGGNIKLFFKKLYVNIRRTFQLGSRAK